MYEESLGEGPWDFMFRVVVSRHCSMYLTVILWSWYCMRFVAFAWSGAYSTEGIPYVASAITSHVHVPWVVISTTDVDCIEWCCSIDDRRGTSALIWYAALRRLQSAKLPIIQVYEQPSRMRRLRRRVRRI